MPDDLYGDEATATAERPPRDDRERPGDEDDEREQDRGETALLPKSIFGGKELNRGDRYEIEIAAIHDEEVSVELIGEAGGEAGPEGETPPEASEAARRPPGGMAGLFD